MIDRLRCVLWFDDAYVEETEVFEYRKVQVNRSRPDVSFLFSCHARSNRTGAFVDPDRRPVAVSLTLAPEKRINYCWRLSNIMTAHRLLPGTVTKRALPLIEYELL